MTPLRVVAELSEPVVYYGDGMHLDGILSAGAYRALPRGEREMLPLISDPWAVDFALPLERWDVDVTEAPEWVSPDLVSDDRIWGWCASAAHADWLSDGMHWVRKRIGVSTHARWSDAKMLNVGIGVTKAMNKPLPMLVARELVWWCRGDRAEVGRLLSHVTSIGKLVNHGMGRVREWRVEKAGEDRSDVRVMPHVGSSHVASIRPPYHHRSRWVPALVPDYRSLRP
jgi:hypothetical protein